MADTSGATIIPGIVRPLAQQLSRTSAKCVEIRRAASIHQ
jgi:hypothetical protein